MDQLDSAPAASPLELDKSASVLPEAATSRPPSTVGVHSPLAAPPQALDALAASSLGASPARLPARALAGASRTRAISDGSRNHLAHSDMSSPSFERRRTSSNAVARPLTSPPCTPSAPDESTPTPAEAKIDLVAQLGLQYLLTRPATLVSGVRGAEVVFRHEDIRGDGGKCSYRKQGKQGKEADLPVAGC